MGAIPAPVATNIVGTLSFFKINGEGTIETF
jgi:hypothetical protein